MNPQDPQKPIHPAAPPAKPQVDDGFEPTQYTTLHCGWELLLFDRFLFFARAYAPAQFATGRLF